MFALPTAVQVINGTTDTDTEDDAEIASPRAAERTVETVHVSSAAGSSALASRWTERRLARGSGHPTKQRCFLINLAKVVLLSANHVFIENGIAMNCSVD